MKQATQTEHEANMGVRQEVGRIGSGAPGSRALHLAPRGDVVTGKWLRISSCYWDGRRVVFIWSEHIQLSCGLPQTRSAGPTRVCCLNALLCVSLSWPPATTVPSCRLAVAWSTETLCLLCPGT